MTPSLAVPDIDPQETKEWLEAMQAVVAVEGRPRAHYLLDQLVDHDAAQHGGMPGRVTTAYTNSIATARQPAYPGDLAIERRLNAYIRWNAMVMVLRAARHSNVGGHIATYQSAAVLYDVGFSHFFAAIRISLPATWSTSRAIPRPASMAAPIWKAASRKRSWTITAAKRAARACRRIRIPV